MTDTSSKKVGLLYEDLTYKVRGAIFEVYNSLGYGHKEMVYQKALSIALKQNGIDFVSQPKLEVKYQNVKVGEYVPDFLVDNKLIIEIKSLEFMTKEADRQMLFYLKGTGYFLGLLVNFGKNKLDIRRKVWGYISGNLL